eukprot:31176-Pelagococcus_subviridis.AAC.15
MRDPATDRDRPTGQTRSKSASIGVLSPKAGARASPGRGRDVVVPMHGEEVPPRRADVWDDHGERGLAVPDLGEASRGVVRRWGRRGRLIGCGGLDVRSTRRARGGAGAARGDAGVRSRAHREVLRRGHDVPRAVLRQVRPVRLRAPSSRSPRTRAPRRSRLILIMFFSRPDPRTPTLTSSVPSRPFSRPQWIRRARARRRPRDVPQSRREEGGARARVPLSHVHVRVLLVHVRVGREGRGGRVG